MGSTNENVAGAFPNFSWFISVSRRKVSPHGANNNERELTNDEKQRFQNNVLANFSVYIRVNAKFSQNFFPLRWRTLGQFVIVWRGHYHVRIQSHRPTGAGPGFSNRGDENVMYTHRTSQANKREVPHGGQGSRALLTKGHGSSGFKVSQKSKCMLTSVEIY